MKVYVFGNRDYEMDSIALKVSEKLEGKINNVEFIEVAPNEDLPFVDHEKVVIMDGIKGIKETTLFDETDLNRLALTKSITVHDFDLGFQLKYLMKLGKLKEITIIGLPLSGDFNYFRIQSILRKLVAQEMQGS